MPDRPALPSSLSSPGATAAPRVPPCPRSGPEAGGLGALADRGTVRPILHHPDPRLRVVCAGLPDDPAALAADLLATMYAAPGRGLAAPQIGVPVRAFVIDVGWREGAPAPLVALEPEIAEPSAETATREEGCLSIPGHPVAVTRPAAVTLRYTDLDGRRQALRLDGIAAVCAQHEADHLNGVLILDHQRPGDGPA